MAPLLALEQGALALVALGISGYLDTLDGSLARHLQSTSDKGAACDIVSDRVVEFSIIFGLYLQDPIPRASLCLLMLGSVLFCISSFLVVGIFSANDSHKSFHYSPGIMERTEAFIFFAAFILFPQAFTVLASFFSLLVALTGLLRMLEFCRRSD
jgi:phosphatidylglycerophosphate synthase